MRKLLLATILILSACAPSQTAIQTAVAKTEASFTATPSPIPTLTSTATATPTPAWTPTPDNTATSGPKGYIEEYIYYLNQWVDGYKAWQEMNDKLRSGEGNILDPKFQDEMNSPLRDMYRAAKSMEELTPPSPEFQYYQDRAIELRINTANLSTLFIAGLLGNEIAHQDALSAFQKAMDNFNDISDKLKSDGFITVKE